MARARNLPVKILGADWQFDGSSVLVFFFARARNGSPDLGEAERSARRALRNAHRVPPDGRSRRDQGDDRRRHVRARARRSSWWLPKFSNISIRMAKEQDLPLNQSKLTGVCGRLKCCLIYEVEMYQEVKGKLPKLGETFPHPLVRERLVRHVRLRHNAGGQRRQGVDRRRHGRRKPRKGLPRPSRRQHRRRSPAHTKGVGTYGSDEVPRQERPTPVQDPGAKRKRRRRGRRGGRDRGGAPPPA